MRATALALLFTLPLSVMAQTDGEVDGILDGDVISAVCDLVILCPHTGACRDWNQQITIFSEDEAWRVYWGEDLPSEYELIADFPALDNAVEQSRVRSLLFRNEATQTSQMITFDGNGNVVVTGHQPQAGSQVVTGIGTCRVPD